MSTPQWDALMWARRVRPGPGWVERSGRKVLVPESTRRHLLLVLATRLDRQMRVSVSVATLSVDTSLSWDQTQRAVQSLVEDGWVGRVTRPNRPPLFMLPVGREE